MKDVNSSECIIVFFDVLGYSDWVTKEAKSPAEVKAIFDKIKRNIESMKSKYVQAQEFFGYLDFTFWSDSLIFILDLEKIEGGEKRNAVVSWFLYFLSFLTVEFLADTGYFIMAPKI